MVYLEVYHLPETLVIKTTDATFYLNYSTLDGANVYITYHRFWLADDYVSLVIRKPSMTPKVFKFYANSRVANEIISRLSRGIEETKIYLGQLKGMPVIYPQCHFSANLS